jgi:hypothetical protein
MDTRVCGVIGQEYRDIKNYLYIYYPCFFIKDLGTNIKYHKKNFSLINEKYYDYTISDFICENNLVGHSEEAILSLWELFKYKN